MEGNTNLIAENGPTNVFIYYYYPVYHYRTCYQTFCLNNW